MKKLILIIFTFVLIGGASGQAILERTTQRIFNAASLDHAVITTGPDTSLTYFFPWQGQAWSFGSWWVHSGGSGSIYLEVSNDNSRWELYHILATDVMTGTDTTFFFDSGNYVMSWKYLRVRCDSVNASITAYITVK